MGILGSSRGKSQDGEEGRLVQPQGSLDGGVTRDEASGEEACAGQTPGALMSLPTEDRFGQQVTERDRHVWHRMTTAGLQAGPRPLWAPGSACAGDSGY